MYNYTDEQTYENICMKYISSMNIASNDELQTLKQMFRNVYWPYVEFIFNSSTPPPKPNWSAIFNHWKECERKHTEQTPVRKFLQNLLLTHVISRENTYTNDLIHSLSDLFSVLHCMPKEFKPQLEIMMNEILIDFHVSCYNAKSKIQWPH